MSSDKLDKKTKSSEGVISVDGGNDIDINVNTDNQNNVDDTVNSNNSSIDIDNKVYDDSQLADNNSQSNSGIKVDSSNLFANMKLSNPVEGKPFGKIVDFASIGLLLVSSIFIGATMGYFLDLKFGTKPYLSIIFLILGLISGVKSVYKILQKTGMMNGQK